jgi:hypothetical protein
VTTLMDMVENKSPRLDDVLGILQDHMRFFLPQTHYKYTTRLLENSGANIN